MPGVNETLTSYDRHVADYIKRHGRFLVINVELTPAFLKIARERIVEGAQKYGDDWKRKDCLKEAKFEEYDLFNYPILHSMQKEYLKMHKK